MPHRWRGIGLHAPPRRAPRGALSGEPPASAPCTRPVALRPPRSRWYPAPPRLLGCPSRPTRPRGAWSTRWRRTWPGRKPRSEEHTSELQSHSDLVCRLLLEKKNPALLALGITTGRAAFLEHRPVGGAKLAVDLSQFLGALALYADMAHSLFFNDAATTEIYTLSLHDALPI